MVYTYTYLINSIQKPGESVAFKREKQCPSTKKKRSCIIRPNLLDSWSSPGRPLKAQGYLLLHGEGREQSHRVCKWKASSAGAARQITSFGRSLLNIYPLQKSCDVGYISHLDYFLLELNPHCTVLC